MKQPYIFSTLRFTYDPLTQEFVNVGIVVYSPKTRELFALCTSHYSRISKLFPGFQGTRFRANMKYIQDSVNSLGDRLVRELPFTESKSLASLLASILPVDDSALRFHEGGSGLTSDLRTRAGQLFHEYVAKYEPAAQGMKRDDEDVWKIFKSEFERTHITQYLEPKRIVAPNYDYQFERAWKNGRWNCYEAVSFDLLDASSLLDKANRWVGRATGLQDSSEDFKLYFLLGRPTDPSLREAYAKAENLLHKVPVQHEFIAEDEAREFVDSLAEKIASH